MARPDRLELLELSTSAETALIAAARDVLPVRGLTHNFYRYPARFSPAFVGAAIEAFTAPGDLVLDNHVGGGTTLVEALARGRHAIGVDISALAEFVATVKTTVYSEAELAKLEAWAARLSSAIGIRKSSVYFSDYAELGYYKHLDHPSRWRLRKAIEQGLGSSIRLASPRLQSFGRCVMLREIVVINRSAAGLEDDDSLSGRPAPTLVLTSPPYPGIHVLYHRFQVDGRKEAPLPFLIANKLDGAGSSYYTMGDGNFRSSRPISRISAPP